MPENFEWVKARAECSLAAAFVRLRGQIEDDVEARKSLIPERDKEAYNFALDPQTNTRFAVNRIERSCAVTLKFERTDREINVSSDNGSVVLSAVLTLGDDGICRLRVKDQELDFWQFRRRALEDLFFGF